MISFCHDSTTAIYLYSGVNDKKEIQTVPEYQISLDVLSCMSEWGERPESRDLMDFFFRLSVVRLE
jgi:hypothetical protein